MPVVVYRYAVMGRPSDALLAEARRAHLLRNEITAIWRKADEKIAALYASAPDVAAAQEAAEAARAEVGELREQIRVRKQTHRTRRPDPELVSRLTLARGG